MPLHVQALWLFILSIPIASVAWTITHEEIFRETREYCDQRSKDCKWLLERKVFYVFTCEYCLSHWITLVFVLLTGYRLLLDDWRGLLIAVFALVWVQMPRPPMGTILQDLRYATRTLARQPGFTAIAVFTLAVGIGANTATYSVVDATLLRSLPFQDPDRLMKSC
jgi:hypothetical protein